MTRASLFLLAAAAVVACVSSISIDDISGEDTKWTNFKGKFNKNYAHKDEDDRRRVIYTQNLEMIKQHNRKAELGIYTYTLAENQFTDLTNEEFNANYLRTLPEEPSNEPDPSTKSRQERSTPPTELDWRTSNIVSPVENQGSCGACYAFGVLGNIESWWARLYGTVYSLSKQQIIDCTRSLGNKGCSGGYVSKTFVYAKTGLEQTSHYPYTGSNTQACQNDSSYNVANSTGYVLTYSLTETTILNTVATYGPLTIGINSSPSTFKSYGGGVYTDTACGNSTINHSVLLVGYGTDQGGQAYWLIKNSWGTNWGEQGYVRIARNQGNLCAITKQVAYAT